MRYVFEGHTLDTDRRELRRDGLLVEVEPQVFDLIAYLVLNRHRVVSKDEILSAVWNGRIVSDSALTSRINASRTALRDTGKSQRILKTLRSKGFRFVAAVKEDAGVATMDTRDDHVVPTASARRPTIAVLPFANIGNRRDQDYFAQGMSEEILTALSRCRWLTVIARNSSFGYKDVKPDVRQIGRELDLDYVVQGSIRQAGDRLRFSGQLITATSGACVWSDRFEGQMSNVFDLQDQFAAAVVSAIEPRIQLAEIERLKHKPAANLDAYDLLLRAHQLEYDFTRDSLAAALRCLEDALARDPNYAPALALAAYCHAERDIQGWSDHPAAAAAAGLQMASRAIEIGKDDGNVLWMAAYAVRRFALDPPRAKDLAYRSLAVNPSSAMALTIAGWTEAMTGNPSKALELLDRAQRLSPRDPRGWFMAVAVALAGLALGQFDDAAKAARHAVDQNPRFAQAWRLLAASLAQLGQTRDAKKALNEALTIEPQLTLSNLQRRMLGVDQALWGSFSQGLRTAGLVE